MRTLTRAFTLSDKKLFYLLNTNMKCKVLDKLMIYITQLGGVIFTVSLCLALIAFGKNHVRHLGFEVLTALSATTLLVHIIKKIVSRERPYNILENINTFNLKLKDYSFPSGHTAASFSIATILYLNIPQLMIPVMLLALLVGISRIYLAVHYPSDVLVGFIVGSVTSIFTHSYLMNLIF